MNTLHRTIMRRIYYAYCLRLLSLPGVSQGFLMIGIIAALSRFVSPGHVFHNLLEVRVGELGGYLYASVLGTEVWTLLLGALFVYCLVSVRSSLIGRYPTYSFVRS